MRISVLASSSKGNSSVLSAGDTYLLVDAGLSARCICAGLERCGLSPDDLSGVFITHEHGDHVRGLAVLGKCVRKSRLHIYCSRYLRDELRALVPQADFSYLEPGGTVQIGALSITPLQVSHDAIDPMGYIFEEDGVRLGYITDTGSVPKQVVLALRGAAGLFIESNYDEKMLRESGRSQQLIERICGPWGHLSNTQAGELVKAIAHDGLRRVILAHISRECNTPELAATSMKGYLAKVSELCSPEVHIALHDRQLDWVSV